MIAEEDIFEESYVLSAYSCALVNVEISCN